MFLLCIYIILVNIFNTTRKGSHRNKIGINVTICIPKKLKEESEN